MAAHIPDFHQLLPWRTRIVHRLRASLLPSLLITLHLFDVPQKASGLQICLINGVTTACDKYCCPVPNAPKNLTCCNSCKQSVVAGVKDDILCVIGMSYSNLFNMLVMALCALAIFAVLVVFLCIFLKRNDLREIPCPQWCPWKGGKPEDGTNSMRSHVTIVEPGQRDSAITVIEDF